LPTEGRPYRITICAKCSELHGISTDGAPPRESAGFIGCWACGTDDEELSVGLVLVRNLETNYELPAVLELMPERDPPVIFREEFGTPEPFLLFLQENLPEEEDE
jgi:hypothetical protein